MGLKGAYDETLRFCGNRLAVGLAACGGPRAFTKGEYGDPEEISMLDDKWNQNDMQLVAKKIINSMEVWSNARAMAEKPVVILEMPRNKTTEHIDMQALYDHVKTALIQSGQFTFLDKAARLEIAQEYEYQDSGYVRPDEAQGRATSAVRVSCSAGSSPRPYSRWAKTRSFTTRRPLN